MDAMSASSDPMPQMRGGSPASRASRAITARKIRPLARPVLRGPDRTPRAWRLSDAAPTWDADLASGAATEPTEDRLARLASAAGPLRRVLAALADRLVATQGHARLSYARLGD
jgi:hypothetical protein